MRILRLDHLVLTVTSIVRTVTFYEQVLAMQAVTYGDGRTALAFGAQKINLHEAGSEFEPKAEHPVAGSGDLCFLVEDLDAWQARLRTAGITIIEGPVGRTGACGPILSIYLRDPDGNLIELGEAAS